MILNHYNRKHRQHSVLGLFQLFSILYHKKFQCRLRPDKSQLETSPTLSKLYRSSSLSVLSSPAALTKPIKYSYRNYGNGIFDLTAKHTMWPRVCFLDQYVLFIHFFPILHSFI